MGSNAQQVKGHDVEEQRTLIVRARDDGWIMGQDLVLPVSGDESVVEILEIVKAIKGVPVTRMLAFKGEDRSRISDKHMTWSLSRNGLYAGDVLEVCPSQPNQWLWHTKEWYEERILQTVEDIVSRPQWEAPVRGCPMSVLEEEVPVPPPLRRDSLKGILRRFPDRLRLELDLVSQKFVAFPNSEAMLPPSCY